MNSNRIPKVLFITGKGRSGSTVLDTALGQVEGFFSLGELWRWRRRVPLEEHLCGCQRTVFRCPVWSTALRAARAEFAGSAEQPSAGTVLSWEQEIARWRSVPRLLRQGSTNRAEWPALKHLSEYASAVYRSVSTVTGASLLVDSSKWPAYPGPLGLVPQIHPYIVHLVRDPRAVVFSWMRSKRWSPGGTPMPRYSALHSTLSWCARHLLCEWVRAHSGIPYLRIRYEDLVAEPHSTLRKVLEFVGEDRKKLPFSGERTLRLGENHTVMGNRTRFQTGEVEVVEDDEWRRSIRKRDSVLAVALSFPLLIRYRYPFCTGRTPDSSVRSVL